MFSYSNDGMSFRAVPPGYTPGPGEVLFSDYATPPQLTAAFPNYQSAVTAPVREVAATNNATAVQQAVARRAARRGDILGAVTALLRSRRIIT